MKTYNGHSSRAAWNVSLWINNDEGLYSLAKDSVRATRTRKEAARYFLEGLNECGVTKTPDGYKYSVSSIEKAMVGM